MGHPDVDLMIEMERRRDEMAEAARYRLIREAEMASRNDTERRPAWTTRLVDNLMLAAARVLSYMGGRMLNWGCRLQTRYELLSGVITENGPSPCA